MFRRGTSPAVGRQLLHQGVCTRAVQQRRRERRVPSRGLHHRRGEGRSLVQQARSEAVLCQPRLRQPASPRQVCLLHPGRVHFQRHQHEREVKETRQQDSGELDRRLQHHCVSTRALHQTPWDLLVQQVHWHPLGLMGTRRGQVRVQPHSTLHALKATLRVPSCCWRTLGLL